MRGTVINFFGGPNVGKSTYAAHLFSQMKIRGFSVALVTEFAQELVFENRLNVLESDQLSVFTEQNRRLLRVVDRFDYVISDSPILLSNVYFNADLSMYVKEDFEQFVLSSFNNYKNINLYLMRKINWHHNMAERRHSVEESAVFDEKIYQYLIRNHIPFKAIENSIESVDLPGIVPNL